MRYAVLVGLLMLGCGADDGEDFTAEKPGQLGGECTPNGVISGADCSELRADIEETMGGVKAECIQNRCTFYCNWTNSNEPDPHPDALDRCEEWGGTCSMADGSRKYCAP